MQREISTKINVLRNGVVRGTLRTRGDSAPVVRMEDSAEIKTVLRGEFYDYFRAGNSFIEFNPLLDELQPVLTINGISGSIGKFLPSTVNQLSGQTISIEAYDRCWRVKTTTGMSKVFIQAGTEYLDAIIQFLTAAEIRNIRKTASSAVFSEDREDWDIGTDYLTIVNQLLQEMNYAPLWFDSQGAAVLEPVKKPTAENIQHILDSNRPATVLHPGIRQSRDIYQTPNVIIVVCDNPEKPEPMTARAVNNNPASPLSVQRRGREIVQFVRVDNIAGPEELQAYADRLIFSTMTSGVKLSVDSGLQLGWGVGDVVGFHCKTGGQSNLYLPDGTIYAIREPEEINSICISRAWEMELCPGGVMKHTLEKVVSLG